MRNILITGGFGLLGKSMVNYLLKKKFRVIVLDYKTNRKKNLFEKKVKNLVVIKGNFIDKKIVNKIFNRYKFSGIFHFGAQTQVLNAHKKPYNTYQVNVLGTLNFLEKLRELKSKVPFIYSSSDKAYGELEKKNYLETDKLNAIFPYDTSKSTSDLISQSYSKTYNIKVGIVRSANIFGPYDFNMKRIVPETIVSALKGKKLIIRSNGKLRRDYIFVEDVCRAYYLIYLNLLKNKNNLLVYNIGSKYNLTTIQIVKEIFKILKIKENYIVKNSTKGEIKNQRLNYNKIKKDLKWKPNTSLNFGLSETIKWYKNNINLF